MSLSDKHNRIQSMNTLSKISYRFLMRFLQLVIIAVTAATISSCQESLEDKAQRQAYEYTRKYCPTPIDNNTRTDSIVFDRSKKVYYYYISFFNQLDDQEIVNENRTLFAEMLTQSVKDSPSLRTFLEAGFRFEYVCHSGSKPGKILMRIKI